MTVKEISSLKEFQQIVRSLYTTSGSCSLADYRVQIGSSTPAVIDFWATWCGPCRVISPVFEQFSNSDQYTGVEFYKVDVDAQQDIAQEVGVKSVCSHCRLVNRKTDWFQMPTFLLFKDGNKIGEAIGAYPQKVQVCYLIGCRVTQLIADQIRRTWSQAGSPYAKRWNKNRIL